MSNNEREVIGGREMVSMHSAVSDTVITFACVPGATRVETEQRAVMAKRHLEKRTIQELDRLTKVANAGTGADFIGNQVALELAYHKGVLEVAKELEDQFKCVLWD
ncbi:hypothetical protein [uncultured Aliiroseovarius sp.]|uniref:hypothetical protein n=1 Tax=uncultured Aliiroseovarius sp. TaxID=1658783 RepID=UPI0026183DD3|nr:hypothetical protein [uncultured Aliiroseovarius sp.]